MRLPRLSGIGAAALIALALPAANAQHRPILPGEGSLSEAAIGGGGLTPRYFLASFAASGLGVGAIALTANTGAGAAAKRWHAWVGVGTGVAGLALSASALDAGGERRAVAAVNGIVGTAALTLAVRALLVGGEAEHRAASNGRSVRIQPLVIPGRRATPDDGPAAGALVRLRF